MNNAPIAIFDSGMGGLSVWRHIRALLPEESLLYFGDGKNCPYPQPPQEVIGYVDAAARFLIGECGAKMMVVACNAATAAAIDFLRSKYSVPIVGMEPAVKPAALSSKSGVIGILATENTLCGALYRDTASKYADRVKILQAVGEGFVELVESGQEGSSQAVEAVRRAMLPMIEQGADRIVLGCTHYPFLAGAMREVIGGRDVMLIDPAGAVARHVADLLAQGGLAAEAGHCADYEFFTASDVDYLDSLRAKSEAVCRLVL